MVAMDFLYPYTSQEAVKEIIPLIDQIVFTVNQES